MRVRGGTVLAGVCLGGVLVLLIALAGVIGGRIQAPEPPAGPAGGPAGGTGPRSGVQPELHRALLDDADLPGGYASTPPPVTASPSRTPGTRPPARPGGTERGEACRVIFEHPDVLAASVPVPVQVPVTASAEHVRADRGTALRQVLAVFPAGGAPDAFRRLRTVAVGCDQFRVTVLEGTTPGGPAGPGQGRRSGQLAGPGGRVERTVRMRGMRLERIGDEAYASRITVTGGRRTLTGYLAVARVGSTICVLRLLGPAGELRDSDVSPTLRRATGKLARPDGPAGTDRPIAPPPPDRQTGRHADPATSPRPGRPDRR